MFQKLRNKKHEIDTKVEKAEPIDEKTLENVIDLTKKAHELKCDFKMCLELINGERFIVDSASFNDIEIIKGSKKDTAKLLIKHNMNGELLLNNTYIEVLDIKDVTFECSI